MGSPWTLSMVGTPCGRNTSVTGLGFILANEPAFPWRWENLVTCS
ncbi:hypothetical protein [uncultured Mobiluncus sp.]|nr:hypothetical protein [uncultured Mobiluncus sp.]